MSNVSEPDAIKC